MSDRREWDQFISEERESATILKLEPDRIKKPSAKSLIAQRFESALKAAQVPPFVKELPFAKQLKRQWRFDFAFGWPSGIRLAVEIEGMVMRQDRQGNWQMGGRHGNIAGFEEDCVKYNTAALLGWTVLRFTGSQVKSGFAIAMTQRVLYARGWRPSQ
jgi:hypothetical protein